MWLDEIWRYPVKSMGGEALRATRLEREGIPGDRLVMAVDGRGRVVTSRSRPRLLLHKATFGGEGETLVDGRPWESAEVGDEVEAAAGGGVRLVRYEERDRFDVLPLLIATDGAIAEFGHDFRRLRPNLIIGGVAGLAERTWEGRRLRIGGAVVRAVDLRARCIMTTFDPDTIEQDVEVLLGIQRRFDGTLALNAEVLEPGPVSVGDPVELLPLR